MNHPLFFLLAAFLSSAVNATTLTYEELDRDMLQLVKAVANLDIGSTHQGITGTSFDVECSLDDENGRIQKCFARSPEGFSHFDGGAVIQLGYETTSKLFNWYISMGAEKYSTWLGRGRYVIRASVYCEFGESSEQCKLELIPSPN